MTGTPVRYIVLVCRAIKCASRNVHRKVPLDLVAVGVLARPRYLCAECLMEMTDVEDPEDQK